MGDYLLELGDSIVIDSHEGYPNVSYGNNLKNVWNFRAERGKTLEVELINFQVGLVLFQSLGLS